MLISKIDLFCLTMVFLINYLKYIELFLQEAKPEQKR